MVRLRKYLNQSRAHEWLKAATPNIAFEREEDSWG